MYLSRIELAVVACVLVAFLLWVVQQHRQVRCLRYCYLDLSDWAIQELTEIRDDYIADHGRDRTPFDVLEVEERWIEKVKYHRDMMQRADLPPIKEDVRLYVLSDLGR